MDNEKMMTNTNENTTAYIETSDKKTPGRILAFISMIMAIISAASALIVGFLSFVIIVLTFLSYVILLPLLIPVMCFIPLLFAITAIVLAKIAKNKGNNTTSVKVGFVLGIISTVFWGIVNVLVAAVIVIIVVTIVLLVVISIVLGILTTVFAGILGGVTAIIGVFGPLVTILTPVLGILAGIVSTIGGEAVSGIIAYLYEFLLELFNTYVVNGAALIGFMI